MFGCYSYKTEKYYFLTKRDEIQRVIDAHKIIVGFNNEGTRKYPGYDDPILERFGVNLKYKVKIDMQLIFIQRATQMKIKDGQVSDLMMSHSLDFITRMIGIVDEESAKKKIDYKVFLKDMWSKEETDEILEYSKRDVDVTKRLYEWLEAYFDSFKSYLKQEDIDKKVYLSSTLSLIAYKAICKEMKWEEKYNKEGTSKSIQGAYVSYPAGEEFKGSVYCFDFASLYPHIMMQAGLYGRKKEGIVNNRPTWNGGGIWQVEGEYYSDKLSSVGELIKRWYAQRVLFKKNKDGRQYSLKIFLNIMYGILADPYYQLVYDRVAAGDCTRLGRQFVKYARKVFKENGYTVIYNDTDSNYIFDPFNDLERLMKVKSKIIEYIKSTVPFPQDTFDMPLDAEIKYMWFFKGGNKDKEEGDLLDDDDVINKMKGYMKKNYIYVANDGHVEIKNLGIRKKSTSALSRKIFWDDLVPFIKQGQIKFKKTFFQNLIQKYLEQDFTLACMRKDVDNYDDYDEKTSLPAQIAQKYGAGLHFLIPNKRNIGVGKGKKYCTVDEYKQHNLRISDIDLENIWLELDYFIAPVITKNIFEY